MVQGRKSSIIVQVTPAERDVLESWQRSTTLNAGLYRRSRIILILADGVSVSETARMVGVRRRHVYTWAERFTEAGPHGLEDKPGRGRKSKSAMATTGASGQFPLPAPETPQPSSHPSWIAAPVLDAVAAGGRVVAAQEVGLPSEVVTPKPMGTLARRCSSFDQCQRIEGHAAIHRRLQG